MWKNSAPQSGHVSNLCVPVGPLIEPLDEYPFQGDRCLVPTYVHAEHPVWTRLELAEGARITSGSRDSGVGGSGGSRIAPVVSIARRGFGVQQNATISRTASRQVWSMEMIVAKNPRFWGMAMLAVFAFEIAWFAGAFNTGHPWSSLGWIEKGVLIVVVLIQFRLITVSWNANSVRALAGRNIAVVGDGEMLDANKFVPVSGEQVASMFRDFGARICEPSEAEFVFSLEDRNVTMKDRAGNSLTQGHINAFRCGMAGSFGQFIRRSDKAARTGTRVA